MELFLEKYQDLINISQKIIWDKKLNIDPSDLVNDAYLYFSEPNSSPFSVDEFKKFIYKNVFNEEEHNNAHIELGKKKNLSRAREQRACKKCGEIKPVSLFPVINKSGRVYVRNSCNDCYQKQKNELRKKAGYKNEKKFNKEKIETISDSYIINSILKKRRNEVRDSIIINARNRILQKRENRKSPEHNSRLCNQNPD